jgi:branched-chain amino acid transport system permease protein
VATQILIFALFAASLDVLWGYTGLFSLGQAAFLGLGGYTAALLMVRYRMDNFWISLLLGVAIATLAGAAFGFIALRLAGTYFLLVTLALGQLVVALGIQWPFLSTQSGVAGIYGVHLPSLGIPLLELQDNLAYYWLVCAIVILCFVALHRFVRTTVGSVLQGIKQNELRMRALGYNTWAYQYFAFIVAAAGAGLAGVLLTYQAGFVTPANLGIDTSTVVLVMVLVGGPGTLYGPAIGAAVILLLELVASSFLPERWPLILGISYVAAVVFAGRGLLPALHGYFRARVARAA